MAFDEYLGERIDRWFQQQNVDYFPKKMMGGLVFMVNSKMCCGIHIDKKYKDSLLMAKIGEEQYAKEITKEVTLPMDFTGRPMKGFIYVTPEGFDLDNDLEYWLSAALRFNLEQH
ncbi:MULTISPECIES: TfoX/Sxy family protein [Flammeovirga]|uniref:TfoX/Sxy family protein n=1 Tax=Flammeovirga agarivorans TaxID=2726742 RepID=A0A7X8SIN9_9BACT|nr:MULTISPECIES: TfoX/Sxy family protein [Flammeovirga]NLR90914.1 TfoX/Sxy family protein [Flammeovirga agarivorans]